MLRIVTIDIATGTTHEHHYNLTSGSGVSEITTLNNHEFIVDERDGKGLGDGSTARVKTLFKIDLNGATDITNLTGSAAANAVVGKSSFVDLVALLNRNGVASTQIPSKIEGIAFGQDVLLDGIIEHTLWAANDNDFVPGTSGPSLFHVVGFTNADLGGSVFVPQAVVPEPGTVTLMFVRLAGLVGVARRKGRLPRMVLPPRGERVFEICLHLCHPLHCGAFQNAGTSPRCRLHFPHSWP